MENQYIILEKTCKTNDSKVIELINSGIRPSKVCLDNACKVKSNSKNIITIIKNNVIPNVENLLEVCSKKDNSDAIIYMITNKYVIPDERCFSKINLYDDSNYAGFVEICSHITPTYKQLHKACGIKYAERSIRYMIQNIGIKPKYELLRVVLFHNRKNHGILKVLFDNGIVIKKCHLLGKARWLPFISVMLCFQNYVEKSSDVNKHEIIRSLSQYNIEVNTILKLLEILKDEHIDIFKLKPK